MKRQDKAIKPTGKRKSRQGSPSGLSASGLPWAGLWGEDPGAAGGRRPAGNPYLMQFQSDIAEVTVGAAKREERYGRWKEAVGLVL